MLVIHLELPSFSYKSVKACKLISDPYIGVYAYFSDNKMMFMAICFDVRRNHYTTRSCIVMQDLDDFEDASEYLLWYQDEDTRVFGEGNYITNVLDPCLESTYRWIDLIFVALKVMNNIPHRKVYGANMGPIWGRQDPGEPHVGPKNFALTGRLSKLS